MADPLVSVVVIFLNEEAFLGEAVESVLAQGYENWELLLVDDGSSDASPQIARSYAARLPDRVRYLQHPGGENRGMSATRNLGISQASGDYIALLDGDDVWLPEKLERQVAILEARPEVDMVYGRTEYWWEWQAGAPFENRIQPHQIRADVEVAPPRLLPLFLSGAAAVPCSCSLLVRASAMQEVRGFEDSFRGLYEDQVFITKMCLERRVYVSDSCSDRYRQHPASITKTESDPAAVMAARRRFLDWVADYVQARGVRDAELWQALVRERWLVGELSVPGSFAGRMRRVRRWRVKLEDAILPGGSRRALWAERAERLGGSYAERWFSS